MTFQPSKIVGKKNSDDDTDINVIKSCLRQEYNLVDAQLNKAYGEAYRYIEQVPRTGVKKPDTEQLNLLKITASTAGF